MKILQNTLLAPAVLLTNSIASAEESLTNKNRKQVVYFWMEVLIGVNLDAASDYIDDTYIQHNPKDGNVKQTVVDFLEEVMPPILKVSNANRLERSFA